MKVLIAVPARYASTRYPGKPLVPLVGARGHSRTLIERSWRAACDVKGVDKVVVATDDLRIQHASEAFGAEVIMTSDKCRNGTERCAEVATLLPGYDLIVNLQGDAPLTPPWFIEDLIAALNDRPDMLVATPVLQCDGAALNGLLQDRKAGRVGGTTAVFEKNHRALYFSKEVIPFTGSQYDSSELTPVFHHVGAYAYRPEALEKYAHAEVAPLERLEGLEQLRFLEIGISVLCVPIDARGRTFWELNNPEDVPKLQSMMREMDIE